MRLQIGWSNDYLETVLFSNWHAIALHEVASRYRQVGYNWVIISAETHV